jgi:hypothetical protein
MSIESSIFEKTVIHYGGIEGSKMEKSPFIEYRQIGASLKI